jgi:membrane protease YdiL (CAAX protease family)
MEHEQQPKKQWGALAAIIFGLVAFMGSQFVVAQLFYAAGVRSDNAANFYAYGAASICTLGLLFVFLRQYNADFRDLGLGKFRPRYIGYALLGIPVYLMGSIIVTDIASALIPHFNADQTQDTGFAGVNGKPELFMVFISLVIIPPIVEELLFRGLLFRGLLKNFRPVLSAIATSAIFGIAHWQWNVSVDVFALSLVLCFMAYKTKSLWPGILLHSTKNFIAFFFLFIMSVDQLQAWLLQHL